ncbi:MAG: sulfatase-like hydrolase/transferase, partial [Candidatus Hydrogenedentota bacterium]
FKVPARPAIPRYNVLYLHADSFNRSHIQIYGYHRKTMPYLEELAKEGVVFDKMINPSGWTNENLVAIFSSLSSPIHKVETRMHNIDPAWITPLEIIRTYGYRAPRLEGWQMDQNHNELGFEELENMHPAEWLEKHGTEGPFFLFHQFLIPHLPYNGDHHDTDIQLQFLKDDMFKSGEQRRRIMSTVYKNTVIPRNGKIVFDPDDIHAISALYDGELAILDREIKRSVEMLEKLGLRENTIIVVSADHGEEVMEHGFVGHASTTRNAQIFDEIVNVPFVLIFPKKITGGKFITTQVRGIDAMPTILELLEIPVPEFLEGKSLMPVIRGEESADRTAFVQTSRAGYGEPDPMNVTDRIRAIRTPDWKLLHYFYKEDPARFELYDLRKDSGEQRNVIDSHPQVANELRGRLLEWITREEGVKPPPPDYLAMKSPHQRVRDYLFRRHRRTDFRGVPSPPQILTPVDGKVYTGLSDGGKAVIQWTGEKDVPYVLEYDVGTGDYHLPGVLEVEGNEQVFGPFTLKYWNTYLTLYSPYKVRVSIDKHPREWSPWVHFEVQAAE